MTRMEWPTATAAFFAVWTVVVLEAVAAALWGPPLLRAPGQSWTEVQVPVSMAQAGFVVWLLARATTPALRLLVWCCSAPVWSCVPCCGRPATAGRGFCSARRWALGTLSERRKAAGSQRWLSARRSWCVRAARRRAARRNHARPLSAASPARSREGRRGGRYAGDPAPAQLPGVNVVVVAAIGEQFARSAAGPAASAADRRNRVDQRVQLRDVRCGYRGSE